MSLSNTKIGLVGIVLGAALSLFACAAEVEGAAGSDEASEKKVAVTAQALTNWHHTPVSWKSGDPDRWLHPESTHVCVLTRLSGKYRSVGWVKLEVLEHPTERVRKWVLHGDMGSPDDGRTATARCFNKNDFIAAVAPSGSHWLGHNTRCWPIGKGVCKSETVNAAYGDWFTSLAGISGGWYGTGELVNITQSSSWSTPNKLSSNACDPYGPGNVVDGVANSFKLESYTPQNARFWGPGGKGTISQAGTFVMYPIVNSSVAYSLGVPNQAAMCALVGIQGRMSGGGEYAEVFAHQDGTWWFKAQSLAGSPFNASVRCFLRDQRPRAACTSSQTSACAAYGCGCVDAVCEGGYCGNSAGCSAQQTNNCAAFGCACAQGECTLGACN